MSFRMVPNSVTLNDLERRNNPYFALISPNWAAFGDALHGLKIHRYFLLQKCSRKNVVLALYHL